MTPQKPEQLDIEAALFVARMDRDVWSDGDEAELQAWLARSAQHPGALLRAEAAWMYIDPKYAQPASTQDEPLQPAVAGQTSRRKFLWGSAAAIAASIAGGFMLTNPTGYETRIGEIRRVPLADGSTVAMNTATKVSVALKDEQRNIQLEKGEAWFQVAKDRMRPFTVEAGRARVRAVGTAFSVRIIDEGTEILVTEGEVEVWADGSAGSRSRLKAGFRGFVGNDASIDERAVASASFDRALAWRQGKIDLEGDRLDHAVAEFNRYNQRKIIIRDHAIINERFDGLFRTDDPEGFAKTVAISLNVPVELSENDVIHLGIPQN